MFSYGKIYFVKTLLPKLYELYLKTYTQRQMLVRLYEKTGYVLDTVNFLKSKILRKWIHNNV